MFDFLPYKDKKRLEGEYKLRVWASLLILWSTVLLIAMFLLVPLVVILSVNEGALIKEITQLEAAEADNPLSLANVEGTVSSASGYLDNDRITILNNVLEVVGNDIAVSNFVWREALTLGENPISYIEISVSGRAALRSDLLALQERLSQASFLNNPQLPVSLFAQEKDIEFTVTAAYDDNNQIAS